MDIHITNETNKSWEVVYVIEKVRQLFSKHRVSKDDHGYELFGEITPNKINVLMSFYLLFMHVFICHVLIIYLFYEKCEVFL